MTEIDRLQSLLRGNLRGVSDRDFQNALAGLEPALAARPGARCQLTLRRLRFWGSKRGDFRFFPGVNVLRAGNDKGKSSVLKMIHLCLTGKNDLKKDVDSWIHFIELYFELDGRPHAVEVNKKGRARGRILECRDDRPEDLDRAEVLAEFRSGKAMQRELESFFNRRFGLRPLMGTQKDSRKGSDLLLDAPTSYRAYVRGLYVNQDLGYTDLVTDGVPYGQLFTKIVGMLLGIRGLDAIFAVEARLAHAENQLAKEERYTRRLEASLGLRDLATLGEEIDRLERYIDELKVERTAVMVRATSNDLDQRLAAMTERLVALDTARQQLSLQVREAESDLDRAENEVAELEAAARAQEVFGPVLPDRWPLFELELTAGQRRKVAARLEEEGEGLRAAVAARLEIARRAEGGRRRDLERVRSELQELGFRADQLAQQKRHLQAQLKSAHQGTVDLDKEIELETRYLGRLEAERDSAEKVVSEDTGGSSMKQLLRHRTLLQAVLRHLRLEHAAANEGRKREFALRVQEYCTTIGFPGLEEVALDSQLRPRIRQNGKPYTFDELSPGEKVRFVLAFYLALAIVTAEDLENGAHPGLLL
ncbi:MAG: hypothetical protein MI919_15915, partial [Holophagales bacterium]|nr:hypothetical protein [Holophagales bacterium]